MSKYFNKLFIFDVAQNHAGSVQRAKQIIDEIGNVCNEFKDCGFQFAFKLQYRDLDTFIHPDYQDSDLKYVKRFKETRLNWSEFKEIKDYIKEKGFITACTPFDENSVTKVIEHDYDIVKVASCSFTDWSLLEEISKHDKPIILSTAGAALEDIDKVVSFFEHRGKDFALLHCVAEYPCKSENLRLGRVAFLRKRYPNIPVGFSDHSYEYIIFNSIIYECHVDLSNNNGYSNTAEDVEFKIIHTLKILERNENKPSSEQEQKNLCSLQRGVYAKRDIKHGEVLASLNNYYLAMPLLDGQLSANDLSKYKEYFCDATVTLIEKDKPIMKDNLYVVNKRDRVLEIVNKLIPIIKESGVVLPDRCELELSHHYGINEFEQTGAAIFNIMNGLYCKKIILMLPNQLHPEHHHKEKTETFNILFGSLIVNLEEFRKGEMITIYKDEQHSFFPETGCAFEEISTTSLPDDSYYTDENITKNRHRKTKLTFYKSWLSEGVK